MAFSWYGIIVNNPFSIMNYKLNQLNHKKSITVIYGCQEVAILFRHAEKSA
jgi:hypothetical protein